MGFPGIVLDARGQAIEGFLFSSDQLSSHWKRLDDFEGEGYERVLASVKRKERTTVDAYLYAIKSE